MKTPWRIVPALAWAGLLFFLSSRSKLPEPPVTFEGIDKLEHATAYGILALLVLLACGTMTRGALVTAAVLTSLYGMSDEIHQMFVPGRSVDVLDWLADTAGGIIALALYVWWRRRRDRVV